MIEEGSIAIKFLGPAIWLRHVQNPGQTSIRVITQDKRGLMAVKHGPNSP